MPSRYATALYDDERMKGVNNDTAMRFKRDTKNIVKRNMRLLTLTGIAAVGLSDGVDQVSAFSTTAVTTFSKKMIFQRRFVSPDPSEQATERATLGLMEDASTTTMSSLFGTVDDQRIVFPELSSGEIPRMFSSLVYTKSDDGKLSAIHAAGSTLGATALIAGTTVGAGILALPTATASSGFIPSTVGMTLAWALMTVSGLLIAELSINRFGETGRPGLGLLDLYESKLGRSWGMVGSAAYFFLHFAMMVAYVAQGGANIGAFLHSSNLQSFVYNPGFDQLLFAGVCWFAMYTAKQAVVEQVNNAFVVGVFASFLGILALGTGSADFEALCSSANQHPENVINSFPILFLALVYQNVVPTVVSQLEGDRSKITTAISLGTTLPFLMFVAWNGVILGNVLGLDAPSNDDPIALLQRGSGNAQLLSLLVGVFSELALITSLIGFVYGLLDAITDVAGLPSEGPKFQKWKPALFAGVFIPPLALSASNPQIFYQALDYGGAFGVSTLFLVLPPIMVWKSRYGDLEAPLTTKPMVPLGKFPLLVMLATAGALIVQQAVDKFGLGSFLRDHI